MKFKNVLLGVGIVVLFALVLWQGLETFYPTPEYTDFCGEVRVAEFISDANRCTEVGGQWNPYTEPIKETNVSGYCDVDYTCRQEYEAALDQRSQVVFYVSLVVAILAFVIGFSVLSIEPIGSALIGSGIWSVFYGAAVNWRNFSSGWRFVLLLVALVLLVGFTLRIARKENNKKGWKFWK